MERSFLSIVGVVVVTCALAISGAAHEFSFGGKDHGAFLLDGKPFQIRGGEMHPGRIPSQYWRHRILMAKAMGLNTLPIYVFWNDHEREEGQFDFSTESRNIGEFLRLARDEGMWVILRPGPYVCGEWDLGGLPYYLLRERDMKLRCLDSRYTRPVERYFHELAKVIRPHLVKNGGPILMVQLENEYGSYPARDRNHLVWLRDLWLQEGVDGPFCTADGETELNLVYGTVPGAAVGLDPGSKEGSWALASRINPGVPVFSAETYPGWLCHWGEGGFKPRDLVALIDFYMKTGKSFNLYVFHGGSNFGFTAGANGSAEGGYAASLTSYDYGAPLDEQGRATPAYHIYRQQLVNALPVGSVLPQIPDAIYAMAIPEIKMKYWTSLWQCLPPPIQAREPAYFESAILDQNQGIVIYQATIPPGAPAILRMDSRDYSQIFLDGKRIGTLERRLGQQELELPAREKNAQLDILVEAMGHINFQKEMDTDRKGVVGSVTLAGQTVTSWRMYRFPLTEKWLTSLPQTETPAIQSGQIFRGEFELTELADTFLDMAQYKKGVVWVNGHNLGRYWSIGPQRRLYCPAPWLKRGRNVLYVLDLETKIPGLIKGMATAMD